MFYFAEPVPRRQGPLRILAIFESSTFCLAYQQQQQRQQRKQQPIQFRTMDEGKALTKHQIITIQKKPEQNTNGGVTATTAADDNDEDPVPLGLTTKAVCMQVSSNNTQNERV